MLDVGTHGKYQQENRQQAVFLLAVLFY